MDTYWLIDRMYGGTGGPNTEDYSKDPRLQNDERYVTERSVEQNTGIKCCVFVYIHVPAI